MMNRRFLVYFIMGMLMAIGTITTASASDLAIYSGPTNPGWISQDAAIQNAETIMNDSRIQAIFQNIENFGDGDEVGDDSPLGQWMQAHTGNGQQDVYIAASGTAPSALYQFPNVDPDGSNIENFIEDGNVFINVADWIMYMSYEGGVRSADNGPDGAANLFDIPGLSFAERNGAMVPTPEGEQYIPSLVEFTSNRPWHVEQFADTDWELTIFANSDDDNADPAVGVNSTYGGIIAAMWQSAVPEWEGEDPRGIGVVEFIANWLTEHGELDLEPGTSVDPQDKTATTWGKLKNHP